MPAADAIILCAGLGTRLKPLTELLPKPAVPLFGRPLVGYSMALLRAAGFGRACINTHWRPGEMEAAARDEARGVGLDLSVSYEPTILGTGGALRKVREDGLVRREAHLLVLNGDVLVDADLNELLRVHFSSGAWATMLLKPLPPGATYSPVELGDHGRIRRIGRFGEPKGGAPWMFTGVHVLSPEALSLLPPGASGVVEEVYAKLLDRAAPVHAAASPGLWLDLGDPKGYLEAHLLLLSATAELGALARCGALSAPVAGVSAGAAVDSAATVVRSAIGEGATVGARAQVEDCVVWPRARVEAGERLRRTIVTPRLRIAVD